MFMVIEWLCTHTIQMQNMITEYSTNKQKREKSTACMFMCVCECIIWMCDREFCYFDSIQQNT